MEIIDETDTTTTISVSGEELRAISGSLGESVELLDDLELEKRMGITGDEAYDYILKFNAIYRTEGEIERLSVTTDELRMIRLGLETCLELNPDGEFSARMGFQKAEVRSIISEFDALFGPAAS